MDDIFIGSEKLARRAITRSSLRWNFRPIFPDVYQPKALIPSLRQKTVGAWLWTGRNGVIAGRAAAALHGALWVDDVTPIELIWRNGRPPAGIIARNERIDGDEIVEIAGMQVTNPERTALDLGRHLSRDHAVSHLDALARATGINACDVLSLADRYPGARGLRRLKTAIPLMDAGAQSPRESQLRLLLIDAGLPAPRTQIRVSYGVNEAFIDMGYDEPMVGLDYDGDQHQSDRDRYVYDIGRDELIDGQGWIDIHVVAEHSRRFILHRVHQAFARRGWTPPKLRPRL